jgi:hypothetical protein
VRKASGVYYTPKTIVDHIVQNTVGKLLEDKTSGGSGAAEDRGRAACGSGPFLRMGYNSEC